MNPIAAATQDSPKITRTAKPQYNYLSQYGIVWGQLTAAVMVTLLPILAVFLLMERRLVAGLSAGATKG